MKKLLAIMMALVMALSLAACGGSEPTPASSSSTPSQVEDVEFTAEQQALAQEFLDAAATFDIIADRVNVSDELRSDEELITTMNEIADEIIAADEYFSSPETLTPEIMDGLKVAIAAIHEFANVAGSALDEIDSAKSALNHVEEGEGIGRTQPLTDSEINYVISLRTESWLDLNQDQKSDAIFLMARWWDVVDGYVVEDFDAVLADLDHQMETYYRNKVDEGVFQTACDIYDINVSNYIMG
ncbi:MAG: hypothetical protein K0S22_261 [Oscillospiraceae bacterium]|nr:hypothetical protein [Oscillospiraceae bacterium]